MAITDPIKLAERAGYNESAFGKVGKAKNTHAVGSPEYEAWNRGWDRQRAESSEAQDRQSALEHGDRDPDEDDGDEEDDG